MSLATRSRLEVIKPLFIPLISKLLFLCLHWAGPRITTAGCPATPGNFLCSGMVGICPACFKVTRHLLTTDLTAAHYLANAIRQSKISWWETVLPAGLSWCFFIGTSLHLSKSGSQEVPCRQTSNLMKNKTKNQTKTKKTCLWGPECWLSS